MDNEKQYCVKYEMRYGRINKDSAREDVTGHIGGGVFARSSVKAMDKASIYACQIARECLADTEGYATVILGLLIDSSGDEVDQIDAIKNSVKDGFNLGEIVERNFENGKLKVRLHLETEFFRDAGIIGDKA